MRSGFSIIDNFLDIIKDEGTEEGNTSIQPHVEQERTLEENVQ